MAPRLRADAELVRRKLARSREHAAELIKTGRVTCKAIHGSQCSTVPTSAQLTQTLSGDQ